MYSFDIIPVISLYMVIIITALRISVQDSTWLAADQFGAGPATPPQTLNKSELKRFISPKTSSFHQAFISIYLDDEKHIHFSHLVLAI